MRTQLLVVFFCLSLAAVGDTATLIVPSEYPNVASALAAVVPGDTISLEPGQYGGAGFTNLSPELPGALTILALEGPENVVIDLAGAGFASVRAASDDSTAPNLNLENLSFTNGYTALNIDTGVTVTARWCTFSDNVMAIGMVGPATNVTLQSCFLTGNDYSIVALDSAELVALDCYFNSNYCAVWAYPETSVDIRRCMFFQHDWTLVFEGASAEISNSLLLLNFVGIKGSDTLQTPIEVSCSNVFSRFAFNYASTPDQTGQNGNISLDPMLCDSTLDTSLSVSGISPLIAENNECGIDIGRFTVGCCCVGRLGNINYDLQDNVDIADIQALIDNLFLSLTPLGCFDEADLNYDLVIDITDLQILIDNQFLSLLPLGFCP